MSDDTSLVTLDSIVGQVRATANLLNNPSVDDDDIRDRVRLTYRELYDLMIQAEPTMWMETVDGQSLTDDRKLILPRSFYKLMGVDYFYPGLQWKTLDPIPLVNRNDYRWNFNFPAGYQTRGRRGLPTGSNEGYLQILPEQYAPLSTYRLLYIPKPLVPVNGTDSIDGINGYERFLIADGAGFALTSIQRDEQAGKYIAEAEATRAELKVAASKRQRGQPGHVSTRQRASIYPYPILPRN